jgi:hypothetical protein
MTPQRLLKVAFGVMVTVLVGVYVLVRTAAQRVVEAPQLASVSLRDKHASTRPGARLPQRYGETSRLLDERL